MESSFEQELLRLTHRLLQSVREADWETYRSLCSPDLTCFEPETVGHLVPGLEFHGFYFELGGHLGKHQDAVVAPCVRRLGEDAAVVAYTRLVQRTLPDGGAETISYQETRVWLRTDGEWKHVHFHRSGQV